MGNLEGAPAVCFNLPLLSFYLYKTSKVGLPLPVSLFLRNRGGLVIDCVASNSWASQLLGLEQRTCLQLTATAYTAASADPLLDRPFW